MTIKMIKNQRCCEKCRFFFQEYDHRGQCRRYPPQAWSESNPETTSCLGFNFPEMRNEEWCGEFQEIEIMIIPEGFILFDPNEKKDDSGKTSCF